MNPNPSVFLDGAHDIEGSTHKFSAGDTVGVRVRQLGGEACEEVEKAALVTRV